jgi:hypothetical protein
MARAITRGGLCDHTFAAREIIDKRLASGRRTMRIAFQAAEGGFEDDGYALICGVSGTDTEGNEHYLVFQRDTEGGDDDWGVHVEFDDQVNGEYNRVKACRLSSDRLMVDLAGKLGTLEGVEGFDVDLNLPGECLTKIRSGLPRIFRNTTGVLAIEK